MSIFTDRDGAEASRTETDIDIEEAARVRLQHSSYRAIRRIRCSFEKGTLVLEGQVPTYHYKQLAQTAIAEIAGIAKVINAIEVTGPT